MKTLERNRINHRTDCLLALLAAVPGYMSSYLIILITNILMYVVLTLSWPFSRGLRVIYPSLLPPFSARRLCIGPSQLLPALPSSS